MFLLRQETTMSCSKIAKLHQYLFQLYFLRPVITNETDD